MAKVFPNDPLDTPALTPGWTVQNSATGSNGAMDNVAGAAIMPFIAQLNSGTATAAQVATAVNTLLTELIAAGLMKAS